MARPHDGRSELTRSECASIESSQYLGESSQYLDEDTAARLGASRSASMLTQHGSPCWPHGLGPQDGILHKLTPGRRAQVGAYELGPGPTSSGRGVREGLLIDYLMLGALLAHVPTSGGPVARSFRGPQDG